MEKQTALQLYTAKDRPESARLAAQILPPLALYAALLLALGELFGMPFDALAVLPGAALVIACALMPKRFAPLIALAAALFSALALALLPGARAGAMTLVNRLYARSEAVNAYAYVYFEQASEDAGAVRAAALFSALFCGAACSLAGRSRAVTAVLFLAAALLEAYFGVTPMLWKNLALFACLALLLLRPGAGTGGRTALLLALAAVLALVLVFAPRPNAAVEAYSEQLRDELGRAAMQVAETPPPPVEEENRVHRESRVHEEEANVDAAQTQDRREFDRETENEREISIPHRTNWLRVILLMLAVIAMLIVPFAPFLLLNRAKRRSAAVRAAFEDEDNAAAIRAMFRHTVNWLCACGMKQENRPFARCAQDTQALISAQYAERYARAAQIWEEAAYSDHVMNDAQRQTVRELMEETEKTLYASSDRKTRLRLKYAACLCEV